MTERFFIPGAYENPLTPSGRGRTIASFHLAQGDADKLSKVQMRRDVLNKLMSTTAVSYWLTQGWLEKGDKIGRVQLVKLTVKGIVTCANSINGGAHVATTTALVSRWREQMKNGSSQFQELCFPSLVASPPEV